MIQSFIIPLKPISWNKIVAKNRWIYKSIKDEWQEASFYAIRKAQICPMTSFPIKIEIESHWKGKRKHDPDIYAKGAIDALVYAKIIPDDSCEYIREICFKGSTGAERDEMIVFLTEIKKQSTVRK